LKFCIMRQTAYILAGMKFFDDANKSFLRRYWLWLLLPFLAMTAAALLLIFAAAGSDASSGAYPLY